ncbi:MAG: glycine oxidase ThiO [Pyrinomonadaceae bacterium]
MNDSPVENILIIGGGIIGLSIARELHKRGVRRITILDKSICGQEASWAAGGMLGPQAEADEAGFFFDVCSASRNLYPGFAAELLDETGIDVEPDRSGTLYLAFTDEDVREIRERYNWQRAAGMTVEHWSADEARCAEPFVSPDVREALFFPDDWQVENRKLLAALKRYAEINGIDIRENTQIERLTVDNGIVIGAETDQETFTADTTVLATGAWTSLIKLGIAEMPFKVEPVRGQIATFQTAKRLFQRVIYSPRGYIVPRADGRVLAGSTSERVGFDKSLTESAAAHLREMSSEIAPSTAGLPTVDHWSGLRPVSLDKMPVIGRISGIDGLYIATAHYRNGILLAPWTAKTVAEGLIYDARSADLDAFAPDRFRLRGVGTGS